MGYPVIYIDWHTPTPDFRKHRPGWGLSQIGNCVVQLALYDLNFTPDPIDARTQRIFKMGGKCEELICDELRLRQARLRDQQKYVTWLGRRGRIDGIVHVRLVHDVLLEVKSMNSRAFAIVKREGVRDGYPHYYAQMVAYLRGLPDIYYALFVAINKDTQEIYEELVESDWEIELALEHKIMLLDKVVAQTKAKRQEYKTGSQVVLDIRWEFNPPKTWKCNYCGFKKLCYPKRRKK